MTNLFFGLKSISIKHYSYVRGVLVLYTASSPNQNYTSKRQNDLTDHKMITVVTVMIITPVPVITVQLLSRLNSTQARNCAGVAQHSTAQQLLSCTHLKAKVGVYRPLVDTYRYCRVVAGCALWVHTILRGKCLVSHIGTSSRKRHAIRRTWWKPHLPSPPRWWLGRWDRGSSCPRPPASSQP